MRLTKREIIWGLVGLLLLVVAVVAVEELRTFVVATALRVFLFVKKHIMLFIGTFILVKGKFIWMVFLKKLALLSATGLGKRYLTERVFLHHLKTHLITPLKDDIGHLLRYISRHFRRFTIVKKIIAAFTFLSSLAVVAKTMGVFLALKVILGKLWSFLLAFFLKIGSAIVYFFSDYLWSSWITPIIEVVLFSWLFSLMERVPMLGLILRKIYDFLLRFFLFFEELAEKIFHIPLRRLMGKLVLKIRKTIRRFTQMRHQPIHHTIAQSRDIYLNIHEKIKLQRLLKSEKQTKKTAHESPYMRMVNRKRLR